MAQDGVQPQEQPSQGAGNSSGGPSPQPAPARAEHGTGKTSPKGNGSSQLNTEASAKPEPLDCPETDYQKKLRADAKAAKEQELQKQRDNINSYLQRNYPDGDRLKSWSDVWHGRPGTSDPEGFQAILRADDGYQTLQRDLDNTANLPDSFFLKGTPQGHLAFMDGLDENMAKLKGPDFGYGKGYESLVLKRCQQKKDVNENTQLNWIQRNLQSDTVEGRALADVVTGLAYGALGARAGVEGNGLGMRARPSTAGGARPVEPVAKPPADEAVPPKTPAVRPVPDEPPPRTQNTGNSVIKKGEPVSVARGEFLETWEDFFVPGTLPFDGSRYLGLKLGLPARYTSPLGLCQISAFDEIFTNPRRGELTYFRASGEEIGFERPFNILESINPAFPGLTLSAPWLRQLHLEEGRIVKHFRQYDDRIYRLESIETLDGLRATFHRSETGVLTGLDGPDGLSLTFENDAGGRRTAITLIGTDGSQISLARYAYDARGRMISADCTFGMSVRYAWSPTRPLLKRWTNLSQRSETVFQYDAQERVVHTATSGLWNDDRFRYSRDRRETVYVPGGDEKRAERFTYDDQYNVTAEINALGSLTRHDFDVFGRETATTDANGNAVVRQYDEYGNIHSVTDGEGRSTLYKWTPRGQLALVVDGAGHARRMAYDDKARPVRVTDAEKHVTSLSYDGLGRPIALTRPNGAVEQRVYDEHNRLVAIIDAKNGETRYLHDAFGRIVSITDAMGGVTRLAYGAGAGGFATPSQLTRPDGVAISRSYDREGTLASVTDGEGRQWTYQRGAFGVLDAIIDPKGGRLAFEYDSEGRLLTVTNANSQSWIFTRDAAGQVIEELDYDGRRIVYERDAAGQVVSTRYPDGARRDFAYDRSGLLIREESFGPLEAGKEKDKAEAEDVTRYWYDDRGLLIQAENKAALVAYERDGNGRITAETVNGRRVESRYDANGLRIERRINGESPGTSNLVAIERDPLGQVERLIIDGHQPLAFKHDRLGRETRRASAGGFALNQTHDAVGQLLSQSVGLQTASADRRFGKGGDLGSAMSEAQPSRGVERRFSWDRDFSPIGVEDGFWGAAHYNHDANGQVTQARHGDGTAERFRYDAAHNVDAFADSAGSSGREDGLGLSPEIAGSAWRPSEDSKGFLGWQLSDGGKVRLARGPQGERIQLRHDIRGRTIERKIERDGFRPKIWRYDWDAKDRLVRCLTPDGEVWRYGYDPFGRRVWKVKELTSGEVRRSLPHMAGKVDLTGIKDRTQWFDDTTEQGMVAKARGKPADRDRPPVVGLAYGWDGDKVIEEAPLRLDGSIEWDHAERWHYEPDSFRPLAKQEAPSHILNAEGRYDELPGRLLYVVCDHLGSPREMFDERGAKQWAAEYRLWGALNRVWQARPANDNGRSVYPSGGLRRAHAEERIYAAYGNLALSEAEEFSRARAECPIRFQGQWEDEESGLFYNRYRYYDPLTTQYLSVDPVGLFGGSRPQAYVENPNSWVDPWGLAGTTYITYQGIDAATGKPYVGFASGPFDSGADVLNYRYSSNFSRFQDAQPPVILYEGPDRDVARGLEQDQFEKLGGLDGTANKQNPVGPRNKSKGRYKIALEKWRKR
ncbi:RHS repeat-associated core domain-containing protein [Rhizobium hainanense]|uniref:RHS repeat-associated core domain-containing protein n=1 Tax=Rhizobium hainanense TaxID=52131 RepID=A0A1C3WJB7_9HYPH|nr:RHS repeat-associated core domain-containing protein [Rhizobium hainanense]SCB39946.1 RHS repeat-associated core domain-containing protein [Rhizobium hainanense]